MRIAKAGIALLLACGAAMTQAAIRVDCEAKFLDELDRLSEPDREVFGLKAKEWKPENVDEWQRQSLACISNKRNWGDAMKDSMRQAIDVTAKRSRTDLFARRDIAMRTEGLRNQVETSKLTQVAQYADGRPESMTIRYDRANSKETRTCKTIRQGIGYANAESYRQAIAFARLCLQTQQTDAETVSMLERQAAGVSSLYDAIDIFAKQVIETEGINPAPDARVKQLTTMQERVLAQVKSLGLPADDENLARAVKKLGGMQAQFAENACKNQFVKAGMPAAWRDNYIVLEVNSPELLSKVVCIALQQGAQVRYLSGGLLSKEGFEVKSPKRTVQIFSEANRPPGADPNVKIMIPVTAKIDGKSVDVTRANLRAVTAELIAAVKNQ